jgi:hypothetical protein
MNAPVYLVPYDPAILSEPVECDMAHIPLATQPEM